MIDDVLVVPYSGTKAASYRVVLLEVSQPSALQSTFIVQELCFTRPAMSRQLKERPLAEEHAIPDAGSWLA